MVNRVLDALGLEQHPDKTFIGRAEKEFDFLGYHFTPESLSAAEKTVQRFVERATRLYEQEPGEPGGSSRFWDYVKRWLIWLSAGDTQCTVDNSTFVEMLFLNKTPRYVLSALVVFDLCVDVHPMG